MYTKSVDIIQENYVDNTLDFDNVIFKKLKYGTVYNIIQVENYCVYIALCQVSGSRTTEHAFFHDRNLNSLGGNLGGIYCGTLIYTQNNTPIRFIQKNRIR